MSKLTEWASVSNEWELAEQALMAGCTRMLLTGPASVGKSYLAMQTLTNWQQLTLNDETTVSQAQGHYVPRGQMFEWHDGPVTSAWRSGSLILNEIGRASAPMLDYLLSVFDDKDTAAIALPSGETIRPHQDFTVIATSNAGPEALDPALQSRIEVVINVTHPHPKLVERLNALRHGLGNAVYASYGDPTRVLHPRQMISCIRLISAGMAVPAALAATFGRRGPDILSALQSQGVAL